MEIKLDIDSLYSLDLTIHYPNKKSPVARVNAVTGLINLRDKIDSLLYRISQEDDSRVVREVAEKGLENYER